MSRFFYITIIFGWLAISSCEKAEKPVQLPARPLDSVSLIQFGLGEHSDDQVYINFLETNFLKSSIKNACWDLGFECLPESSRIIMNGGKGVFIGVIGRDNFIKYIDPNKVKWRWDESSGGDSIVLKNWCNPNNRHSLDSVYLIDRGPDVPMQFRYYQFKIEYASFGTYIMEIADLYGKKLNSVFINKDPHKNMVFFDFEHMQTLNFEPENNDWQICFLKCRWIYYEFNPPLLYTVTGIHINPKMISVAIDSSMLFESITKKDLGNLKFSSRRDVMGFDWKIYDFGSGRYIARKYVNYIIRTKSFPMKTYKLRFTDYYNRQGIKGSPKFEVAEIK